MAYSRRLKESFLPDLASVPPNTTAATKNPAATTIDTTARMYDPASAVLRLWLADGLVPTTMKRMTTSALYATLSPTNGLRTRSKGLPPLIAKKLMADH